MSTETSKMTEQNPVTVLVLSLVTGGIYYLFWLVKIRAELVRGGADIPTPWLVIVPIAVYWFIWVLAGETAKVTGKPAMNTFVFLLLLGGIGAAIVQSEVNATISR